MDGFLIVVSYLGGGGGISKNVLSMDKVSGEEFRGDDGEGCLVLGGEGRLESCSITRTPVTPPGG